MSESFVRRFSAPYSKEVTFRLPRRSVVPASAEVHVDGLFHAALPGGATAVFGAYTVFILFYRMAEKGKYVFSHTAMREVFALAVPGGEPDRRAQWVGFVPHAALRSGGRDGTWTVTIAARAEVLFDLPEESVPAAPEPAAAEKAEPDRKEPATSRPELSVPAGEEPVPQKPALETGATVEEPASQKPTPETGTAEEAVPQKPAPETGATAEEAVPQKPAPEAGVAVETRPVLAGIGESVELTPAEGSVHCWRVREDASLSSPALLELSDVQLRTFMEETE